jgi:hypothetical protein
MMPNYRYDYLLIWGHGLAYENDILTIIESYPFEILYIHRIKPKSIKKLVRAVYSYDYAPFEHIKTKTRYLHSTTPAEVLFIFFRNDFPQEYYTGEGAFRHIECAQIKKMKTQIRELYNPRMNGEMSHDHVIHASDNSLQTHYILKWLGMKQGIYDILPQPFPFIDVPYHFPDINQMKVRSIPLDRIHCRNVVGSRWDYQAKEISLVESVQYRALTKDLESYSLYLDTFRGTALKEHYSVKRLLSLEKDFNYLAPPHANKFIILSTNPHKKENYFVLDGLHRAAILKKRHHTNIFAAIIK